MADIPKLNVIKIIANEIFFIIIIDLVANVFESKLFLNKYYNWFNVKKIFKHF